MVTSLRQSGLPHAVEAVDAPLEVALHAGGVVHLVALAVVCFLEAHHSVEARVRKALVVLGRQGHHLDGEVVEIGTAHAQRLLQIVGAGGAWILAGDEQQVLEWAETADGAALGLYLLGGENHTCEFVVAVEAAVHARVGARVGDVHGYVHRNHFAEALLCERAAHGGHALEIGRGSRRDEGHEVVDVATALAQRTLHIGGRFGGDAGRGLVPVVFQ